MTINTDGELRHLAAQHRQRVALSGIHPHVALARGCRSAETKADLRRLGFTDAQCRVPALVLPVWSVFREIGNYQIRPDDPRIQKGKPVKYELPSGSQMLLDAHPQIW